MLKTILLSAAVLAVAPLTLFAKTYTLKSPSGRVVVTVDASQQLTWSVAASGETALLPSAIAMQMGDGQRYGAQPKVTAAKLSKGDGYAALTLQCKGQYNVELRAYDEGAAYRFVRLSPKATTVKHEQADFCLPGDPKMLIPYVNDLRGGERYCYSFESYYDEQRLSQMFADSIAITPLCAALPSGRKVVVMEQNVEAYPGMFLKKGDGQKLVAEMAPLPDQEEVGGFDRLNLVPTSRHDYIARINGRRAFPWRMVVVSERDTDLLTARIVRQLDPKSRVADTSWVKPGKVAWDWWNNWNLKGVPFRAGVNTDTYKYYVDFAHNNRLEYVILDEGWSDPEDLLVATTKMDVPAIVSYATQKGVGIILWASWRNLTQRGPEQMERIMSHYERMGVKGFKVDFFDRDDQRAMESAWEVADCAARHHLLLDLHGLKPTGIQAAYPNILNFEGVKGLENSKWEPRNGDGPVHDQPCHDCLIPYLRQLAGPLDYTPGAMNNATRDHFFGNNNHPMSQGTRVHQMAMYTIFHAPIQMLADSPTAYEAEQECTDFIAAVPTVWDETVALAGEMGQYVAMARRKGSTWWIAAMTNWNARTITIPLSGLKGLGTKADVFADGVNADREATDYQHTTLTLSGQQSITVTLAPGGGWTARVSL